MLLFRSAIHQNQITVAFQHHLDLAQRPFPIGLKVISGGQTCGIEAALLDGLLIHNSVMLY